MEPAPNPQTPLERSLRKPGCWANIILVAVILALIAFGSKCSKPNYGERLKQEIQQNSH